MKKEGRDPYQHPYQDIDPDVWKFMIDHRFNDSKWEVNQNSCLIHTSNFLISNWCFFVETQASWEKE